MSPPPPPQIFNITTSIIYASSLYKFSLNFDIWSHYLLSPWKIDSGQGKCRHDSPFIAPIINRLCFICIRMCIQFCLLFSTLWQSDSGGGDVATTAPYFKICKFIFRQSFVLHLFSFVHYVSLFVRFFSPQLQQIKRLMSLYFPFTVTMLP